MSAITFLFTDIEGSTRLWDAHPAAMQGALADHDELITKSVDAANGRVFKHTGDGVCAVFSSAGDAVEAAAAIQRQLPELPHPDIGVLKVRMGIHTGEVEERDGDFFGPPLNRVARLMSVAHGGQVLVSLVTERMTRLGEGLALTDLGEHRLRDLTRPETIFQLEGEGLAAEFPPLRTPDAVPNNLPSFATSFVGRDQELEEVRKLLRGSRLLTVTGAGGSGKTRLALQAVADMGDTFPDGTWLIELAPVTDPDQVATAVAGACGAVQEGELSITDALVNRLRGRSALLVFDNCEHLIEAVADLVDELFGQLPDLIVVATSRELLGVGGEVAFALRSLSMPGRSDSPPPGELARYDAVRLFVERGTASQPAFRLTSDNSDTVLEICRRLDGMPLALELAAARLRTFTPGQIADNLDSRFRLLTGGSRTALPRQQTLMAAIDWSYRLLEEAERSLFERLSVFQGGFTLEAVGAVCADEQLDALDVLELLPALVDKSLVAADLLAAVPRYRMLETIRQFSRDRLDETTTGSEFRLKHAEHFEAMSHEAGRNIRGPDEEMWWGRIDTDLDNLRQAMTWALEAGQPALAMSIATGFWRFWWFKALAGEGANWLRRTIEAVGDDAPDLERANALLGFGSLAEWTTDRDGIAKLEQSVELFKKLDREGADLADLADSYPAALINLSVMVGLAGDLDRTEQLNRDALDVASRLGDDTGVAVALGNLAESAARRNDVEAARALSQEAIEASKEMQSAQRMVDCYFQAGLQELHFECPDRAITLFSQGEDYAEGSGLDLARDSLAVYRLIAQIDSGATDEYQKYLLAVRTLYSHDAMAGWVPALLNHLVSRARIEISIENWPIAARLLGAASGAGERAGRFVDPMLEGRRDIAEAMARRHLGDEAFEAEFDAGRRLNDIGAQELLLSGPDRPDGE